MLADAHTSSRKTSIHAPFQALRICCTKLISSTSLLMPWRNYHRFGRSGKTLTTVQKHSESSKSAGQGSESIPETEGWHMANTQQQRRCCHSQACLGWEFQVQPESQSEHFQPPAALRRDSQCTELHQITLLTLTATSTSVKPSLSRAEPLACTSCPVSSTTDRNSSVHRPSLLTSCKKPSRM